MECNFSEVNTPLINSHEHKKVSGFVSLVTEMDFLFSSGSIHTVTAWRSGEASFVVTAKGLYSFSPNTIGLSAIKMCLVKK